jgi:hypothetical protein
MGSIESRISCACRRPALYPGPELPLLRSQHHLCAESSGMDRSCPRSMGHGRALLQRLPDTAPSAGELSVGRLFRITEKTSLSIRAEFTNAFNRTLLPGPTSTNALATQTRVNSADPNSKATVGFGFINTTTGLGQERRGQIVVRFRF